MLLFKSKALTFYGDTRFNDWAIVGIHKRRSRLYELYAIKSYSTNFNFIEYVKLYLKK